MVFNIKMRTEVNIQIMANPATVIFKIDHPGLKHAARAGRAFLKTSCKVFMRLFDRLKSGGFIARLYAYEDCVGQGLC
jgi:hypothetical protein